MTCSGRKAVLAASLFLWTFVVVPSLAGQDEKEGQPIVSIVVKSNMAISEETIRSKLKSRVGDNFSQQVLNEDLKRLYATDYFLNVAIDARSVSGGIEVTILVEEKPIIDSILFDGNKIFSAQKLKSLIKSKENEILDNATLTRDMVEIRKFYEKKGYPHVGVAYKAAINPSTNRTTVTVTVDEKIRVKVAKVSVTGNSALKTGQITKAMSTKPAWFFFTPGAFEEDVFKEDLEKVKALYDDAGFLDAEVTSRFDYSSDGRLMYITLEVNEGKKYITGDVSLKGTTLFPDKDLRKQLMLVSGKAFSSQGVREDLYDLREFYEHRGYMNVQIDVARNLNPETGNIDLVYTIDAKDIVYVGKIDIRGNTKTKDIVIRRELRLFPGDRFDGDRLRRSKERLYNLGFFEDVYFDTETTREENVKDLVVTVKEAKTGEFAFGGGYSTVDQLLGFVQVTQRNFDLLNFPSFMGGGQNLTIRAEVGMVRQNYFVSWTDPWILGLPFSFGFDGYHTTHARKERVGYAYEEERSGGDVRLGKEFTDQLRGDALYRLERVTISSVADNSSQDLKNETGTNWISSATAGLTYDTRDNIYSPTQGWYARADVMDAGGIFGGDKNFVKTMAQAAIYFSIVKKVVLELKGTTGIASAYGKTEEVPIYERFFTGGQDTIRGYGERKVSPRDPGSFEPIGGEAMIVGNAELTFPIYEKILKGAVFFDTGNTWRRNKDYADGDFRSGTGVGIRVKTPIGPLRLDYGYPLSDNYGDKKEGQFYFSVSQGF